MFGFNNKKNIVNANNGVSSAHNSLVSGTNIVGNVNSKTDIRVDGTLEGNLISEARVVVGKNGLISGNISCISILIEGKVEGNINAKEKLHLSASAVVTGDIYTNKLIIEDGAEFSGMSIMNKATPKKILMENLNPNQEKQKKKSNEQTNFLQYSGMAFQMGAIIGLFIFLGIKLDRWFATKAVFTVIGSLFGVGLALYSFIKKVMTENK